MSEKPYCSSKCRLFKIYDAEGSCEDPKTYGRNVTSNLSHCLREGGPLVQDSEMPIQSSVPISSSHLH